MRHARLPILATILAGGTLLQLASGPLLGAAKSNRHDEFTQKFAKTPDQARVIAAGYLGGSGTEWLVSGGFQPDGTVVVAGVTLGPTLDLGSTRVTVLGKDTTAPPAPEPPPQRDKTGKPITDKDGKPKVEPRSRVGPRVTPATSNRSGGSTPAPPPSWSGSPATSSRSSRPAAFRGMPAA
jgi:hypothetical protein